MLYIFLCRGKMFLSTGMPTGSLKCIVFQMAPLFEMWLASLGGLWRHRRPRTKNHGVSHYSCVLFLHAVKPSETVFSPFVSRGLAGVDGIIKFFQPFSDKIQCELNVAEVTDRGEFQSTNERQIWDSDNAHKNEFTPNLDCKAVPFFSPNLSERRGCDWRGPGISRQSHPRRSLVGREKRDCFAVYTKSVRINLTYLLCNRNLSEAAVSLILLNWNLPR